MTKTKKLLSVLLSVILLFCAVSPAFAAVETPFENSRFYEIGDYSIHYRVFEAKEQEVSAIKNEISATEAREEAEKILANTEKELQIAEQEYQKALKAYNMSLAKPFVFSGTEQDRRKSFV